jgi:hypothetical protein
MKNTSYEKAHQILKQSGLKELTPAESKLITDFLYRIVEITLGLD